MFLEIRRILPWVGILLNFLCCWSNIDTLQLRSTGTSSNLFTLYFLNWDDRVSLKFRLWVIHGERNHFLHSFLIELIHLRLIEIIFLAHSNSPSEIVITIASVFWIFEELDDEFVDEVCWILLPLRLGFECDPSAAGRAPTVARVSFW